MEFKVISTTTESSKNPFSKAEFRIVFDVTETEVFQRAVKRIVMANLNSPSHFSDPVIAKLVYAHAFDSLVTFNGIPANCARAKQYAHIMEFAANHAPDEVHKSDNDKLTQMAGEINGEVGVRELAHELDDLSIESFIDRR